METTRRRSRPRHFRRASRGQSLVEFALVAPMLVALIFSIVEGGMLLYIYNSAQHASSIGQETVAADGTVYHADADTLVAIDGTDFGRSNLVKVTEVDIYMLDPSGDNQRDGTYSSGSTTPTAGTGGHCTGPVGSSPTGCFMQYRPGATSPGVSFFGTDGTQWTAWGNWPPSMRNVSSARADYAEIDIHYDYHFFTMTNSTLHLVSSRFFRLEPQVT